MDISSVNGASFNRSVTPTRSGSDRHVSKENEVPARAEDNQEQKSVQQKQAQRNIENQSENSKENESHTDNLRRLDGRLFTLEQTSKELSGQELDQNRSQYIRERVNQAYTPANRADDYSQQNQTSAADNRPAEAIDIVV